MSTIHQRMQRMMRLYKEKTGKKEIDMKELAKWAALQGWEFPKPVSPLDRLAQDFCGSGARRNSARHRNRTSISCESCGKGHTPWRTDNILG